MAKIRQLGKLRITTWILAFVMMIASCALIFSACSGSSSEEEEETEKKTDTQTFANGDFEYFDDSDGAYLIASPDSWTSSTQGSTSLSKSGIVDTSVNWGEKFVYARTEYEKQQDEDNTEDQPDEYYTDIDSDYDVPGWDMADAKRGDDDDAITYENISAAEIDAVNPGTHFTAEEEEENGTHVLMLHNYRSNGNGTAAKYAASSITVQAGSAVMVSVWVKTYGLTYNDNTPVDGNRGAYVEITNTVGGSTQDPLVIKNIDTEKLNAANTDNGWVQYTVYLKASSYAATTFTVNLGLGRTNNVSDSNYEYVQGYAFFDDLKYEVMTAAEYDTATAASDIQNYALDIYSDGAMKIDSISSSYKKFALDLDTFSNGMNTFTLSGVTVKETTQVKNGKTYTLDNYLGTADAALLRDGGDATRSGVKSVSNILAEGAYDASVQKDFEKAESLFGTDAQYLMLYSGAGAPYTATLANANVSATDLFTVAKDDAVMIRFWVKTSELGGGTGATVTLVDSETETAIGSVDTTTLTAIDLKDDNGKQEDIFDGWQQCYLYVSNDTDLDKITFTLKFNFGPASIADTTLSSYRDGYAAFTGFEYSYLESEELSLASTGTYAVKVSLVGSPINSDSTVVFDDAAYAGSTEGSAAIESGFANLRNYSGVYGNSKYVGGSELKTGVNEYAEAGLLNKKYSANYRGDGDIKGAPAWLQTVVSSYTTALDKDNWWNTVVGKDSTQPLFIVNSLAEAVNSYGFVGAESSLSSSSYAQVNLRVKLSEGAKAYIYLIDASSDDDTETKYTENLKYTSGVSYMYDEDGNVVTVDPEDKAFNAKTDTLFYKQDNGLWSTTEKHTGDTYFANLANYETDEDGNLVDSSDNVVYYKNGENYYRYYDEDKDVYSVQVKDFTQAGVDADKLAAATLQAAETGKELVQVIEGTSENAKQWIYVNFFLASGNEAKTYRLEVWNGSRDGSDKMAAKSYVIFDKVSYETLDSTSFTEMLEEALLGLGEDGAFGTNYTTLDAIKKAYREDASAFIGSSDAETSLMYYHFSLFDSKDYASYDEDSAPETRESDPYADYTASSYSDTVAFLKYNGDTNGFIEYNTFVNYGASEIAVSTSTSDTDDDTTDTTTDNGNPANLWLLIPSIVLAAALFLTLLSMLIKKLLSNIKRNKRHTSQYDAKRTRYIRKLKLAEAEEDKDEGAADVLPDEDEIDTEELYRVESAEEENSDTEENGDSDASATEENSEENKTDDENK